MIVPLLSPITNSHPHFRPLRPWAANPGKGTRLTVVRVVSRNSITAKTAEVQFGRDSLSDRFLTPEIFFRIRREFTDGRDQVVVISLAGGSKVVSLEERPSP